MQKVIFNLFLITLLLSSHRSISATELSKENASTDPLPNPEVYYETEPCEEFDLYEYAGNNKGFALFLEAPYTYYYQPNPFKAGTQKTEPVSILRLYLPEEQTIQNYEKVFSYICDCIKQKGIDRVIFCLDKPVGGPKSLHPTSAIVKGFDQACTNNKDKLNNVEKIVYNLSGGGANLQLFFTLSKKSNNVALKGSNEVTKISFEAYFQEYLNGKTLYVTFHSDQHQSVSFTSPRGEKDLLIDKFLLENIPATQAFLDRDRQNVFNKYIVKSNDQEIDETTTNNYQKIYECYNQGFCPPGWTLGFAKHDSFDEYARAAKVYCIKDSQQDPQTFKSTLQKTIIQRDPVNISMVQGYHKAKLKQYFGYENSFYTNYYKLHKKLAPTFAIYTKTPCILYDPNEYADTNYHPNKSIGNIHVLNVIGAAFDNPKQPDQQYFLANYTQDKKDELISFYKGIFDMTFACAIHNKFEKIMLAGIGLGAFSHNYPGSLINDIWLPAFKLSYDAHKEVLKKAGINEISCIGSQNLVFGYVDQKDFKNTSYGNIPAICTQEPLKSCLDKTLYLNAWDPHSLPGNGNAWDYSLDGYWGRVLAIAALGWLLSNPHLLNNILEVDPDNLTCKKLGATSLQKNPVSQILDIEEQKESKEDQEKDTTVVTEHVLQNPVRSVTTKHTSMQLILSNTSVSYKNYCGIDAVQNVLRDLQEVENLKKDPSYNQYAQATQLYTPFGSSLYDINLLLTYREDDSLHNQAIIAKFAQENKDATQHLKLTDGKIYPSFAIYTQTPLWEPIAKSTHKDIHLLHCFLPEISATTQLPNQPKQYYQANYNAACNLIWQCILEKEFEQITFCIDTHLNTQGIFSNALKETFDLYKARLMHTNKLKELRYATWVHTLYNMKITTALNTIASTGFIFEKINLESNDFTLGQMFDTSSLYITFGSNSDKIESTFLKKPAYLVPQVQTYLLKNTWKRLLLSPLTNPSLDTALHPLRPSEKPIDCIEEKPAEYNPLQLSRKQLCNLLVNSVYRPESRPPLWINRYYGTEAWYLDAKSLQIYRDSINDYQFNLLACKRLPTHTSKDQKEYDAVLYQNFFGITSSGHEEIYQMYKDHITNTYQPYPPVMSFYFTTPFVPKNAALNQCYPSESLLTGWLGNIHILRVAGLDFSPNAKSEHKAFGLKDMRETYQKIYDYKKGSNTSLDQKASIQLESKIANHYKEFSKLPLSFVESYYKKCFDSIFTCYENNYKQFTRILLPAFGGGNFAALYPLEKVIFSELAPVRLDVDMQVKNQFKKDIFFPALESNLKAHGRALQNCGLKEILCCFTPKQSIQNQARHFQISCNEIATPKFDPSGQLVTWEKDKKYIQEGLLIVVAGNNETLFGNANNALPENSQERIFGTTTAGVVLSWMLLNPCT
ncbi:MAG: hypothetical protein AAF380_00485 [Bacteroidota bacterium]